MPSCARFVSIALLLTAWGIAPAAAWAQQDLSQRITEFSADLDDLGRRYDVPMSGERSGRFAERYAQETLELATLRDSWESLGRDARIDWLLLDSHVRRETERLQAETADDRTAAATLPFAGSIARLCEARRRRDDVDAESSATEVTAIAELAARTGQELTTGKLDTIGATELLRHAQRVQELRRALRGWFEYRNGYDPSFSWWVRAPYETAEENLDALEVALRAKVRNQSGDSSLVGHPIGETALLRELRYEWIPYSPAELVAIAEREFAWCDAEMAKAARAMGCADDWRMALTKTKLDHRPPGEQPAMIRELAAEAIGFLRERDLITIPELAEECWRMRMMSPAAQRVNPFFLGGETIQVSFPTDSMQHHEKLMSLRSNNEHFCRATVHHELIPGHWLQQFMQARHRQYRRPFGTPFWIEGWALYWEMRLYDLGLAATPEDKVGFLYWRKHRCARIVFSLNFHLGRWSGPECVKYLIERVGHEPAAAEAEVRRSVSGGYGPLYQAAYMLGGLQIRAMHAELVDGEQWTERRFHDEILRQGSMPIAVLRAALRAELPSPKLPDWRFADAP